MHPKFVLCLALSALLVVPMAAAQLQPGAASQQDEEFPVLRRVREGGTPYDENQSMYPYAIRAGRDIPTSGVIDSPPEYSPTRGVVFSYISSQWSAVVTDLVVKLTNDPNCPTCDEVAYVVVPNSSQQSLATNQFTAAGANMSKVFFVIFPLNAIWMRDYGPHFIWQDGALAIADSHYYPTRPADNFIPTLLGDDYFLVPTYDMGLYYSGGNFQPGPGRMAIMSSLINADNPASQGFSAELIAELFNKYQGIDVLHIFPQLPYSVDGTGHIDMWMYLVNDNTCIVSEYKPGSNQQAIDITNNGAAYMANLGWNVYRTPAWNAVLQSYMTNFTYTNAFRVNNRIFVPTYGQGNPAYLPDDNAALATWQTAAGPTVSIIPVNSYGIIWAAGALHCIVMQVPRRVAPSPAVHVVWPDGGELIAAGSTQTIQWTATDTNNAPIPWIDLYYSTDNGANWHHIVQTSNTGSYLWTVPNIAAPYVKVRVVATAADLDQGEGISADFFQIAKLDQTVYDFKSGGGVNKFGWGYQTVSWASVDTVRKPVTSEISSLVSGAYGKIAYSDATGAGWSDPNRYICPTLTSGYESTHTFEFTITQDPNQIDDIAILWEGFADMCTQCELYVWDYTLQRWADGSGLWWGQNRYMDNWAGNRDGYLTGNIRSDFSRFIDPYGQLTLLNYAERQNDETFHDYVSVTVSIIRQSLAGDLNCDDVVNFSDINPFVQILSDPVGWQATYPGCPFFNGDCNNDGQVDFSDINAFVAILTGG